jgi:putative transposase
MSEYRRLFLPGGCYFFTVVTHRRRSLFADTGNISLLREAFREVQARRPFEVQAIVVLPDHLHCLWRLPDGDADFSARWRDLKNRLSRGIDTPINRRGEKMVWQRRFWEHAIRDEDDWARHADYIHYNPVKHGYVRAAGDWPYSSFRKAVREGWYRPEWGRVEPEGIKDLSLE